MELQKEQKTTSFNSKDKANNWLIADVLLAIACLLLLAIILIKYYLKRGLAFHVYYCISIMIENLVRQRFFQEDNKRYFTSNNNIQTYYDVELFFSWMRQNHKKVLERFLKDKDIMQK